MKIHLSSLPAAAREHLATFGRIEGDFLEVAHSPEFQAAFTATQINALVNPPTWPIWAMALTFFKADSDTGLGDTLARIVGPIGGDAYKAWYLETFGRPCGCEARQEDLNLRYPYSKGSHARQN